MSAKFYQVIENQGIGTQNWLIWKHPECEVNNNSKLIVRPGQVAIIVQSGQMIKLVEPGTSNIDSDWFPILKNKTKEFWNKKPYPIEFYFVNTRLKLDFLWGTNSPIPLRDPKYGLLLYLRARGQFGLRITKYEYLYRTLNGSFDSSRTIYYEFIDRILRGWINQNIKKIISKFILEHKIPFDEIIASIDNINEDFKEALKSETQKLGMEVVNSSIEDISIPKEQQDELNKILKRKAEVDIMGDDYAKVRGYDVYQDAANNSGSVGTFFGEGIGLGLNEGASNLLSDSKINKSATPTAAAALLITCGTCGSKVSKDSKFCFECGSKIATNKCSSCNIDLSPNAKFCVNCGKKVK